MLTHLMAAQQINGLEKAFAWHTKVRASGRTTPEGSEHLAQRIDLFEVRNVVSPQQVHDLARCPNELAVCDQLGKVAVGNVLLECKTSSAFRADVVLQAEQRIATALTNQSQVRYG